MAPAYKNINSDQIIVSDEARPDLEALARWVEIPESEIPITPAPAAAAPVTAPSPGDGDGADPASDAHEGVESAEDSTGDDVDDSSDSGDDDTDEDGEDDADETAAVPDETWSDEALDALAKERGVTYRSNASKATKVAKLTAPAGE